MHEIQHEKPQLQPAGCRSGVEDKSLRKIGHLFCWGLRVPHLVGRYPYYGSRGGEAWNTNISLSFTSHTADRMEGVGIPEQARHGIDKAYGYSAILLKINTFGVASSSRLGDLLML